MWFYDQRTGLLSHNGVRVARGYSGLGPAKNNPSWQDHRDIGPIPRGRYQISTPECVDAPGPHGPYVLGLTPDPQNEMFGRAGFLIHGDSIAHPGTASHGCLILPRPIRSLIADSGDSQLTVS